MSTRGTYEFQNEDGTSQFCYVHFDNYPEGASIAIWKTLTYLEQHPEAPLLDAFMKMNDRAGLTESHEAHSDTEYRYTFKSDHTLIAEKSKWVDTDKDNWSKEWSTIYDGNPQGFLDQHLHAAVKQYPLHIDPYCVEYNQMMLKLGADPNRQDQDGDTPLHECAKYGKPEVLKLLLDAGADPSLVNKHGKTPAENTYNKDAIAMLNDYVSRALETPEVEVSPDRIVTAMLNGDAVKTTLEAGQELTDGLTWEDENGFDVTVESLQDLTHVEYWTHELDIDGQESGTQLQLRL